MASVLQSCTDRAPVRYATQSASREDIASHLRRCDALFVPALTTRVDIADYARKLHERAFTFEAWGAPGLVGLVAAYLNEPGGGAGFVSNVSVDPDRQGIGIARSLLGRCIEHARALGFARLQLEVGRYNGRAQVLYRRLGFATESEGPEILVMRFDLRPEARLAG